MKYQVGIIDRTSDDYESIMLKTTISIRSDFELDLLLNCKIYEKFGCRFDEYIVRKIVEEIEIIKNGKDQV